MGTSVPELQEDVCEESLGERSLKNDIAWQKVAERMPLLQEIDERGFFRISAKELQQNSDERQPRLMVKFDYDFQRPTLFRNHKLNILPLKRGNYVVFRDPSNVCYFEFEKPADSNRPLAYTPKSDLDSFDTLGKQLCASECDAVDLAFVSGLLESFCQTSQLTLTKRGRFGSDKFPVVLPGCGEEIWIESAQIEVDSVYESADTIVLIEAKMGFHKEFHQRQLYYPFIWLSSRTEKRIVPILLCYSNGEYQLNEFRMGQQFGDASLVRQQHFVLGKYSIAPGNLDEMVASSSPPYEVSGAFPQADDLDKVVDIVRLAHDDITDQTILGDTFGFTERQAYYYLCAAQYLGFLDEENELTPTGVSLVTQSDRLGRTRILLNSMFSRPVFREAMLLLKSEDLDLKKVSTDAIASMITRARPEYAVSTARRRAGTVRNWLKWLLNNCELE